MIYRLGRMNNRVTIQKKSVTRAANGEEVVIWVTHKTVWAEVAPIRGNEFFAAAQMQGAIDYRVTVLYDATILRDMRVLFGSTVLDIVAEPINVKSANRTTELMCISGIRDG